MDFLNAFGNQQNEIPPYELKILKWDDEPQTNKQTNKQKQNDIPRQYNTFLWQISLHSCFLYKYVMNLQINKKLNYHTTNY